MCCDLKPRPGLARRRRSTYVEGDANDLRPAQVADVRARVRASTWRRPSSAPRRPRASGSENFHHNVRAEPPHRHAGPGRLPSDAPAACSRRATWSTTRRSTSSTSRSAAPAPLAETDPVRPRNLCGGAKLMHEKELDFLDQFPGTPFTSVSARIFRVYGRGSKDVVSRWVRSLTAGLRGAARGLPGRGLLRLRLRRRRGRGPAAPGRRRRHRGGEPGQRQGRGASRSCWTSWPRASPGTDWSRGALGHPIRGPPGRPGPARGAHRLAPADRRSSRASRSWPSTSAARPQHPVHQHDQPAHDRVRRHRQPVPVARAGAPPRRARANWRSKPSMLSVPSIMRKLDR